MSSLAYYLRDIDRYRRLSAAEELRLAEQVRRGDEQACQRLVQGNLRLVIAIARRFRRSTALLEDLIEEGNIGLMQAARRYDPRRGVPFGCYAAWWIRKFVREAIKRHQRQTTVPSDAQAKDLMPLRILSFEELPRDGRGSDAVDSRIPTRESTPDEYLNEMEVADGVRTVVALMSEQQRFVLEERHGINGHPSRSLQRIADSMGCTREWVRQLEHRALDRARNILESRGFRH